MVFASTTTAVVGPLIACDGHDGAYTYPEGALADAYGLAPIDSDASDGAKDSDAPALADADAHADSDSSDADADAGDVD